MRQIINNKLYNTDSATLKAYWDTPMETQEEMDEYEANSLYRTDSGEYFLWITEAQTNTNKLEVLNEESLMDWLERNDYSDAEIAKILDVELA